MSFPISDATPIRFAAPLPARADVVIIGGGVIGVMTAWHLVQKGLSVVLCEKGRIAGEQSSRNWGWVRQQGRDPSELPIMAESLSIWKRLAAEMGEALGFQQTGVMYLAKTQKEIDGFEAWTEHSRAHQLDTRLLTGAETAAMLKGAVGAWKGALWTASDARAEPWVAVPMLAAEAEERGVVIVEACAVRGLDIAAGKVAGVVTEAGRIACDHVVVAAGAWSRLFLGRHGVKIPEKLMHEWSDRGISVPLRMTTSPSAAGPMAAIRWPPAARRMISSLAAMPLPRSALICRCCATTFAPPPSGWPRHRAIPMPGARRGPGPMTRKARSNACAS